jgi:hypothetical protein
MAGFPYFTRKRRTVELCATFGVDEPTRRIAKEVKGNIYSTNTENDLQAALPMIG